MKITENLTNLTNKFCYKQKNEENEKEQKQELVKKNLKIIENFKRINLFFNQRNIVLAILR